MAKRGNNEGSIYQRSDGRWAGAISLAGRKRKSFYGKTRREVQQKLVAALRDQQQGLPVIGDRQTVRHFLERWIDDVVRPSVRVKTFESYSSIVRLHVTPELGRIRLGRLSPEDVQAMMNHRLATGLTPRTVQYIRAVLRRALGQALKWGLVSRNVAVLVDPPRVKYAEVVPLSPDQARMLLSTAAGSRLEALFVVTLALGLRQGEALGLRWSDVDLDARSLRVSVALQRIGGMLQLVEPKTDRSRRTIDLPDAVVSALHEHRVRQLEERLLAGSKWQEHGLVFTSMVGTPLDARNVVRQFKSLLRQAGLPDCRFHDLRHSCASFQLAAGASPREVMELLGHSQITLTMNTYAHIQPALRRAAAERMQKALWGSS